MAPSERSPDHPATHFQLPREGARPFNFGRGRNKDFYLLSQPARDDRIWGGLGGVEREGKGEAVLLNASFGKGKQRILGLPGWSEAPEGLWNKQLITQMTLELGGFEIGAPEPSPRLGHLQFLRARCGPGGLKSQLSSQGSGSFHPAPVSSRKTPLAHEAASSTQFPRKIQLLAPLIKNEKF